MAEREIIKIDEEKCNGCGLCIPNCPEGALQVIDGKARLISDLFCDGLGACIGHCPEDAIEVEKREAEPYDERKVMENVVKQGKNVIKAHLLHLKGHGQAEFLGQAVAYLKEKRLEVPSLKEEAVCAHSAAAHSAATHAQPAHAHADAGHGGGCPGAAMLDMREGKEPAGAGGGAQPSQLRQWPVQIKLVPPNAPYFNDADLLIAADCVPFADANFHENLLKGKILLVGCPKLDDVEFYQEKITEILKQNTVRSVTCAHMEVPCCYGLVNAVQAAVAASGKDLKMEEVTVTIRGDEQR